MLISTQTIILSSVLKLKDLRVFKNLEKILIIFKSNFEFFSGKLSVVR